MHFLKYKNNELHFGLSDIKLFDFTKNYLGPQYIYDLKLIETRFQQMQKEMPQVEIYYAMKANSHPQILKKLAALGAGADVVSWGEAEKALANGFVPEKIVFSGVGKTKHEIKKAIEAGLLQINVESLPELLRIAEISRALKKTTAIALRLNPDVDIKTHPYIATGLKDNKFGMELSQLSELTKVLLENKEYLILKGVSLHLGSQMLEFSGFEEALLKLVPVFKKLLIDFPQMDVFDFGGGLGIFYEKQDLEKENELLREYSQIALKILKPLNVKLQTEPGRWLVAHAGALISQVQYLKKTSFKEFVILDTGMNHLLRPSLYGAYHSIWPLKESHEKIKVDIVGPICESGDFFAKDRTISKVEQDDFVVIADSGAYGFSMANIYNLHSLPEEICIE